MRRPPPGRPTRRGRASASCPGRRSRPSPRSRRWWWTPSGSRPTRWRSNVDRYMGSFRAQRKWVVKVALLGLWLYPLRFLKPPFPRMKPRGAPGVRREALRPRHRVRPRPLRPPPDPGDVPARRRRWPTSATTATRGRSTRWATSRSRSATASPKELRPVPASLPRLDCVSHARAERRHDRRRRGGGRERRRGRDRRLPPRGGAAGASWCWSAASTCTRRSSARTRSSRSRTCTPTAPSSSRATSASRCSRACAWAARRWSTTRSASTCRTTCCGAGTGRSTGRASNEARLARVVRRRCASWLQDRQAAERAPAGRRRASSWRAPRQLGLTEPAERGRRGRGEHRGLPRQRLLQHRLPVRHEAVHARQGPARGTGALRGRQPARSCPSAARSGSRRTNGRAEAVRGAPGRRAQAPRRGADRRRLGRRDRLELAADAEQDREVTGRPGRLLQHGLADHGRLRRRARLLRRRPDLALPPAARRERASSWRPGSTRWSARRSTCPAGSTTTASNMGRFRHLTAAGRARRHHADRPACAPR